MKLWFQSKKAILLLYGYYIAYVTNYANTDIKW